MGKWFKPAGAVLLAIATAALYVWPIPPEIISKWGFLVFFLIFCAYMFWYVFSQNKQISKLEKNKPDITVDPFGYLGFECGCLKVTNIGEKGDFWVMISLLAEFRGGKWISMGNIVPTYDGVWESNDTNKTEIPNGKSDYVKISRVVLNGGQTLELLKYDSSNKSVSRRYWQNWETVSSNYAPKPEYKIQVRITAYPSLKDDIFIRDYNVTLNRIEDLKTRSKITTINADLS
jgi:hypothetical protein